MNKNVELLLKLDELVLQRKGLDLANPRVEQLNFAGLDKKIDELRRQLPGPLISTYDKLARQWPDPVTVVVDGVCQGCQQEVSTRLAVLAARSIDLLQCEHCGRFVVGERNAPDYV